MKSAETTNAHELKTARSEIILLPVFRLVFSALAVVIAWLLLASVMRGVVCVTDEPPLLQVVPEIGTGAPVLPANGHHSPILRGKENA